MVGLFTVYTSAQFAQFESDWKAAHRGDDQLVFAHRLGELPAQLGVFFSARCSDDDFYISVVRYSWGAFNPVEIEVNERQVVLHLSRYLHMGGFWIPSSWHAGRYYAYSSGCFKVTASSGAAFDSGWVRDKVGGFNGFPEGHSHYIHKDRLQGWQVTQDLDGGSSPGDSQAMDADERAAEARHIRINGIPHMLDGIPKTMLVYFSPHAPTDPRVGKEAYAILHGYSPMTSGNPASIWADHKGIHLEMWRWRWLRGTWRSSCEHLDDASSDEAASKVRAECKPGWRFHFRGSWRVYAMGCHRLRDTFGVSPKDIFG